MMSVFLMIESTLNACINAVMHGMCGGLLFKLLRGFSPQRGINKTPLKTYRSESQIENLIKYLSVIKKSSKNNLLYTNIFVEKL